MRNALDCGKRYGVTALFLFLSGCFLLWYRSAPPDGPRLLLTPVARLAGLLSGTALVWESGAGYHGTAAGIHILVEKSCSGGNFLLLCFVLLLLTHSGGETLFRRFVRAGVLLLLSWGFAVLASGLRIAATIFLFQARTGLDPVLIHNVTGIITYLTLLCLSYFMVHRLVERINGTRTVRTNEGVQDQGV